jgi:hypothetical protein
MIYNDFDSNGSVAKKKKKKKKLRPKGLSAKMK